MIIQFSQNITRRKSHCRPFQDVFCATAWVIVHGEFLTENWWLEASFLPSNSFRKSGDVIKQGTISSGIPFVAEVRPCLLGFNRSRSRCWIVITNQDSGYLKSIFSIDFDLWASRSSLIYLGRFFVTFFENIDRSTWGMKLHPLRWATFDSGWVSE